jgi:hypothetical protein
MSVWQTPPPNGNGNPNPQTGGTPPPPGQQGGGPPPGWTQGAQGEWLNPQGEQMNFQGGTPPWVFDESGGGNPNPQSGWMPPPPGGTPPPGGGGYDGPYDPFYGGNGMPPPPTPPGGPGGGGGYSGWNPQGPGPADYDSVRQYSDAAYDEARRYLDPQQEEQNRRFEQSLINRGIDPQSASGQQMLENLMRGQGDQNSGAAFGSMQFGQGIQDQMWNQANQDSRLAGEMTQSRWDNESNRYGTDVQRYGMDINRELGEGQLDYMRQGQDWNQMMDLDNTRFRNRGYNDSQQQYQDQLYLTLLGNNPVPGGSTINPDGSQSQGGNYWGYNVGGTR